MSALSSAVRRLDAGVKLARSDRLGDQGLQAWFNDRTGSVQHRGNLQLVWIDTPHLVAVDGETGSGDGTDIAEAEDYDLHIAG